MKTSKSRNKVSKDREKQRTESVEMQSWSNSSESVEGEAMETDDLLPGKKLMTDLEETEHLQLCMKLATENKINAKNAFGLHLIDIMRHLSTTGNLLRKDLQEASLSLAASTSIYICRVDALHKETMQYHSNLQNLAGKKSKKIAVDNEDDPSDGDMATSGKIAGRVEKRKFKSRLANENEVTQRSSKESHNISKRVPHENFSIINASFSCSRTCSKLLHNLQLSSDDSRMDFTKPEKILRPKQNCPDSSNFRIMPRIYRELSDIKQFEVKNCLFDEIASESFWTTPGAFKSANRLSRRSSGFSGQDVPGLSFSEDDHSMCMDNNLMVAQSGERDVGDIEYLTDKLTTLDITCDIFVSDLSKALKEVAGGRDLNVDATLLPVDSILKKMLDKNNGTMKKPQDVKVKKKRTKKEHNPFFSLNDQFTNFAEVLRLFNPGKNLLISDEPSDWLFENTSAFEEGYTESDAEIDESDKDLNKYLSQVLKAERSERIRALKVPFLKGEVKVVQNSVRNKFFCVDSKKMDSVDNPLTMLTPGDTRDVEEAGISFGRMSLHDDPLENVIQSFHELVLKNVSLEELESEDLNFGIPEDDNVFSEKSFIDESTLDNLLVEPPVLVKPAFVKFEKKQTNVDTDHIKKEMFRIISTSFEKRANDSNFKTCFSEVYTELKNKRFEMSMQYAFVLLLLLSNEKCFFLQPAENGPDILIFQDVNEVE